MEVVQRDAEGILEGVRFGDDLRFKGDIKNVPASNSK